MKAALWTVFASLALLWTGAAALLAKLVEGVAQTLAAGGATLHPRKPGWLKLAG